MNESVLWVVLYEVYALDTTDLTSLLNCITALYKEGAKFTVGL